MSRLHCLCALSLMAMTAPVGAVPVTVTDADGSLGRVNAPVRADVTLTASEAKAAAAGRLILVERSPGGRRVVRAQFVSSAPGSRTGEAWWLLPGGPAGRRVFDTAVGGSAKSSMTAGVDPATGQVLLREGGKPVLRYNYRTVEPGDMLNQVAPENRIYTVARSDYIHPLYGPGGVELTRDWPLEHPHHRGIYWAWPEVDWHGQRGDLHALQHVFARPTGKLTFLTGPVFAQVTAENEWRWEGKDPLVRETATIRAYAAGPTGRVVDLRFEFAALGDDVLLARRGAAHYGGLNVRLAPIQAQRIDWHTDPPEAKPRMAWETMAGKFAGQAATVAVFQHPGNPEYPGDWVKYPELNWSQPTFPASGTRYRLARGAQLTLRFRVWAAPGDEPKGDACASLWRAFAAAAP